MICSPWGAKTILASGAFVAVVAIHLLPALARAQDSVERDAATPDADADADADDADASAEAPPPPEADASSSGGAEKKTRQSDIDIHASLEIGAYQDSNATSVLTPSVAARVENPTAGWGVNGRYLVDVVTAASPDIVATA